MGHRESAHELGGHDLLHQVTSDWIVFKDLDYIANRVQDDHSSDVGLEMLLVTRWKRALSVITTFEPPYSLRDKLWAPRLKDLSCEPYNSFDVSHGTGLSKLSASYVEAER